MLRKLWISAVGVGLAAASAGALADHDRRGHAYDEPDDRYGGYEYARVIGVEPLRRRVRVSEPVRECWEEVEYASDRPANHVGGTLLGALVGGVIGNQVGSGRGRRVSRAAGAIIGGAVGNSVSRQRERERERYDDGRVIERCDVRYRDSYEERIDGYDVTYEYAGRRYLTRLPYDPGDRIRIRVDVSPAE